MISITNGAETTVSTYKIMRVEPNIIPICKSKLKMITDIIVRAKIIKLS